MRAQTDLVERAGAESCIPRATIPCGWVAANCNSQPDHTTKRLLAILPASQRGLQVTSIGGFRQSPAADE